MAELAEIVEIIRRECDYADLCEDSFYDNVIHPFKMKYQHSFTWANGASKGVLIFKDLSFVLKFPFRYNEGDYDCEAEEYVRWEFCGAEDGEDGWNYCEAEFIKYQEALEEGLSDCFATIKKIQLDDYNFVYCQEFANIYSELDDDTYKSISCGDENSKNQVTSYFSTHASFDCFNRNWLSDCMAFYGEKVFDKLLKFIKCVGIGDLHGANIGYIGIRPVLVDFSDFNE